MFFRKRSPNSNSPWLTWIVLAFVVYLGYLHFTGNSKNGSMTSAFPGSVGSTPQQANTVATTPPGVTIAGDISGIGDPASCGQTAALNVTASKPDGAAADGPSGALLLPVGVRQADKPWAPALSGMKKGGVREVVMSAREVYGDKEQSAKHGLAPDDKLHYKIEMTDLTPASVPGMLPFRASDLSIGRGNIVYCGERVQFHLDVWKEDGSLLFSSKKDGKPLEMTIGASELFYGIDRGLVNMHVGSIRSVIVPPAYLTPGTLAKADPRFAQIPGHVLIADVQLLDVVEEKGKK